MTDDSLLVHQLGDIVSASPPTGQCLYSWIIDLRSTDLIGSISTNMNSRLESSGFLSSYTFTRWRHSIILNTVMVKTALHTLRTTDDNHHYKQLCTCHMVT